MRSHSRYVFASRKRRAWLREGGSADAGNADAVWGDSPCLKEAGASLRASNGRVSEVTKAPCLHLSPPLPCRARRSFAGRLVPLPFSSRIACKRGARCCSGSGHRRRHYRCSIFRIQSRCQSHCEDPPAPFPRPWCKLACHADAQSLAIQALRGDAQDGVNGAIDGVALVVEQGQWERGQRQRQRGSSWGWAASKRLSRERRVSCPDQDMPCRRLSNPVMRSEADPLDRVSLRPCRGRKDRVERRQSAFWPLISLRRQHTRFGKEQLVQHEPK